MPGDADVTGGGEPADGDPPLEKRVSGAGDADQGPAGEPAGTDLGVQVAEDAQFDVGQALAQRGTALQRLRHEDDVHVRGLGVDVVGEGAGQAHEERFGGLHGEGAPEMDGAEAGARPQDVVEAARQLGDLVAEFEGARGEDKGLPCTHQQRVADSPAQPGEGAADRRGRGAEALGGPRHAVLLKQGAQDRSRLRSIKAALLSCVFAHAARICCSSLHGLGTVCRGQWRSPAGAGAADRPRASSPRTITTRGMYVEACTCTSSPHPPAPSAV